ncbi:hypothetical protein SAMN05660649_04283 [Desulfotomaculum arcticum]|uniref:Uncharacterized protein n=1 Tax=Desulfotruncus arcticus DSM 17038 TaxID=1121424 RepID=A0A1I2Y733_9FIRM|nr:guanylate kinase [Desulfotruncus arcticus]SFH21578.1 hypothetical protein SAMN05660649_04283 [Desulfotomaculum arcticum] [Desulfotruncus arcticus DSM 17038]
MEGLVQDFLYNLSLAVLTLLASIAIYGIKKMTDKLVAETNKIDSEEERGLIHDAIFRLDDVAEKTVKKIEQTVAKEMRQAVKDGVKSKEDLIELSKVAFNEIKKTMEPEYVNALKATLGDVDAYIRNTIEAKVLEIKEGAI